MRETMSSIAIRPEKLADIPSIEALHLACFEGPLEARLIGMLRDAGRLTVSLVAEEGEEVVGHVGFSPVTAGGEVGMGLAPLAVREASRGRRIGSQLILSGLDAVRSLQFGFAVVLGSPSLYGRCGFEPASRFGLVDEYGGGEAFQVIPLRPGGVPQGAGIVRYATEFGIFGPE